LGEKLLLILSMKNILKWFLTGEQTVEKPSRNTLSPAGLGKLTPSGKVYLQEFVCL